MTRIFWVTCPRRNDRFCCRPANLRHSTWKLRCPYCEHEYPQEESPCIEE